jgi:hypothetical protein
MRSIPSTRVAAGMPFVDGTLAYELYRETERT